MALAVAVVGCGGAGTEHARAYKRLSGQVELVGVCDVVAERAARLATEVGAKPYSHLEELLKSERLDLVSVCTAEYHHAEPVLAALAAGCHVLCEKPLAATVADGRRLVEAAGTAGRVLGVDYNYRHMPVFRGLRDEIAGGGMGEVVLAQISAHAYCYHHALDLVRFLFGDVVEVDAWVDDVPGRRNFRWTTPEEFLYVPSLSAAALLRTRPGTTVALCASGLRSLNDTLLDIEVVGTRRRVAVRGLPVDDTRPREVETWPSDPAVAEHLGVRRPDQPAFSLSQAFSASVAAFVQALAGGSPVPTDGTDGLAVLSIDQAVVQSHRFGTRVRLAP